MEDQESQVIHSFSKNDHEKFSLSLRKYKGKHYIDFRLWFQTKSDPTFRPTRKGIIFPIEYLAELSQGINRLAKAKDRLVGTDGVKTG